MDEIRLDIKTEHIQALLEGKNSVQSGFKDEQVIIIEATRDKVSKRVREFMESLETDFNS